MGISTTKLYAGHVVMAIDDLGALATAAKAEAIKEGDSVVLTLKVTGVNSTSRRFKATLESADVSSPKPAYVEKARHETAAVASKAAAKEKA